MNRDFRLDVAAGVEEAIYRVRINDAGAQAGAELQQMISEYFNRRTIKNEIDWWNTILNGTVVSDPDLRKVIDWRPWLDKIHTFPRPAFGVNAKAQQIAEGINEEFRQAGYPVDDMLRTLHERRASWERYIELATRDDQNIAKFGRLPKVDFVDFDRVIDAFRELGIFSGFLIAEDARPELELLGFKNELVENFDNALFITRHTCEECGYQDFLAHGLIFSFESSMKDTQVAEVNSQRIPPDACLLLGNGWWGRYERRHSCDHFEFVNFPLVISKRLNVELVGPYLPFAGTSDILDYLRENIEGVFEDISQEFDWEDLNISCEMGHVLFFTYQGPHSFGESVTVGIHISDSPITQQHFSGSEGSFSGECYEGAVISADARAIEELAETISSTLRI